MSGRRRAVRSRAGILGLAVAVLAAACSTDGGLRVGERPVPAAGSTSLPTPGPEREPDPDPDDGPSTETSERTPTTAPTSTPDTVGPTTPTDAPPPPPATAADDGSDPDPAAPVGRSAVVTEVTDGDTFTVLVGGMPEDVRLIGVDAPETGECWADRATALLRDLLGGTVVLVPDATDRDRFDRLLRYADRDGSDVGVQMVRRGAAISRTYPPDTARQEALDDAERAARAEGIGLWAPDACGPVVGANLAVSAINENPPGDDNLDLNGEWIEITNRSTAAVELAGWVVRDESASHRYAFPPEFVLGAGATVRLSTGCGTDTADRLHWCMRDSAVWNNSGDTVFVLDPNGNVVVSRSYSG